MKRLFLVLCIAFSSCSNTEEIMEETQIIDIDNLEGECEGAIDFAGPPEFRIQIVSQYGEDLIASGFFKKDDIYALFFDERITNIVNPGICECPNIISLGPYALITEDDVANINPIRFEKNYSIFINLSRQMDTLNYTLLHEEVRFRSPLNGVLYCGLSSVLKSADYNGTSIDIGIQPEQSNPIPVVVVKELN